MAKNPAEPRGVVGAGSKLTKTASYGHFGSEPSEAGNSSVREPGRPTREPRQGGQRIPHSPAPPYHPKLWASPSYDPATGRACKVAETCPPSHAQIRNADEGPRGAITSAKPRFRPGRW